MMCIRPGAVTAEDLIAFAVGEGSASVAEHVRSCPSCLADARAYARTERGLSKVLDRFDCPSPQTLGEFELGLVMSDDRWSIARHVADCPRCAAELRSFRSFLADEPVPAPSFVEKARRLVAAILAPAPGLAYGGMRGSGELATLTFQAEDVTITLGSAIDARRGSWTVEGLLLLDSGDPEYFAGREVRLVPSAEPAIVTIVDELGNFTVEDVAPGGYRLELDLPDRVIFVDELPLGS